MLRLAYLQIFVLFCFVNEVVFAQDIHFSQFANSPLNLNPAQTGLFNGDYRIMANQRSQWSAVPIPYSTFSLGADMRNPIRLKNQTTGAGLVLNSDKAGDSDMRITQAISSFSWLKKLTPDSSHILSIGIQTGVTNKSFNTSKLTFDSQYNGDTYDASMASNEAFAKSQITYLDFGAGLNYVFRIKERMSFSIGTSFFHLNTPKQSFMQNSDVKLGRKMAINTSCQFKIAEKMDMIISSILSTQGKYKEIVAGTAFKYIIDTADNINAYLGNYYRVGDADIIIVGLDYKNMYAGLSYDINLSSLKIATNGRGGFELSFIYILQKFVPIRARKTLCPIYM